MKRWWAECVQQPVSRYVEGSPDWLGGELYTVRADSLVQARPRAKSVQSPLRSKRGKPAVVGRPPKAEGEKQKFLIGGPIAKEQKRFERLFVVRRSHTRCKLANKKLLRTILADKGFSTEEIDAGLSARTPTIAARKFIVASLAAKQIFLEYDTVAKYHREYLRAL